MCWFDQVTSGEPENWGDADYWMPYKDAFGNPQALDEYLAQNFPYNRTVLPCRRTGCQGHNCAFSHTAREFLKGLDCPLSYQCPNSTLCLFKHPSVGSTTQVSQSSLPQPGIHRQQPDLSGYGEITAPKPIKQWQCPSGHWNTNSGLRCERCNFKLNVAGSQSADYLPKCSVCGVDFYCVGVQTLRLKCGHLFCQLCVGKMKWNGGFGCWFDQMLSEEPVLAGNADYWMQCKNAGDAQALEAYLAHNFQYNKTVLPCRRTGCQGRNCAFSHTAREVLKGLDCPLSYQCPNSTLCLFKHPNEASTLPVLPPVSLPQPVLSPYDDRTAPKPKNQWQCRRCGQSNYNSGLKCDYCGKQP